MSSAPKNEAYRASALVITLMFIILLGLEALVVGLVLNRSTGTEAVLRGKNMSVKNGANLALNSLANLVYTRSASGIPLATLLADYKRGGSVSTWYTLTAGRYTITNPETGSADALPIDTAAWIQEVRGNYVHLVGRAKTDEVDLLVHRWILLSPCTSAGLTTIMTNIGYPGMRAISVDASTGRVFFSAVEEDAVTLSNMYSWHASTGLSTLLPSTSYGVGSNATFLGSDGTLYFGSNRTEDDGNAAMNDKFWVWKDNVLTTVISGLKGAGRWWVNSGQLTYLDDTSNRVYFGTAWQSNIYTYKSGVLTTIYSDAGTPNDYQPAGGQLVMAGTDEIFFTDDYRDSGWRLYRWTAAGGLQTPVNLNTLGVTNDPRMIAAMSDGRVWLGEWNGTNRLYTYKTGGGLSTISGSGYAHASYWTDVLRPNQFREYSNGYAFIGTTANAYYWNPASPHALTAIGGAQNATASAINSTGTLVAYAPYRIQGDTSYPVRVWGPATGLSTLPGTYVNPGSQNAMFWYGADTLYFATEEATNGRVYSWNATTQALTTIVAAAGVPYVGVSGGVKIDSSTGRVYIGTESNSGNFYTYHPSGGLSTIVSGMVKPGGYIDIVKVNPLGGVFFGQYSATSNFYYYNPTSSCAAR